MSDVADDLLLTDSIICFGVEDREVVVSTVVVAELRVWATELLLL
jgi:hypothetical protein